MRFAYADPPYPGCAHLYPEKQEVDHAELIALLCREFPDGWALSTHVPGLRVVLPLCPEDVRVMAWVKPWCSWKPGQHVSWAWEPVLVRGGRKDSLSGMTRKDWCAVNATTRRGMEGAKPKQFCWWLFEVLGAKPGDELVDLYPGTGDVTRAWDVYMRQLTLALR